MRYENSLLIDAPASTVWDLTVDVARWPAFVPTMRRVEPLDPTPLSVGGRARVKQPMQPAGVWTVTALEPGRRFAWQSNRGAMTWTAEHEITEADDGGCRNTLRFEATGRGAGLFALLLGAAVRRAIDTENDSYRKEAERLQSGE